MNNDKKFKELSKYYSTVSEKFLHEYKQFNYLLTHTPTIGDGREEIIRGYLKDYVPKKFSVAHGFVFGKAKDKETDIIIYDSNNYSPLFKKNDLVIVPPESVSVIIEIKSRLNKNELKKALSNLIKTKQEILEKNNENHTTKEIKSYIFSFQSLKPKTIMQHLKDIILQNPYYQDGKTWEHLIDGIFVLENKYSILLYPPPGPQFNFPIYSYFYSAHKNYNLSFQIFLVYIMNTLNETIFGKNQIKVINMQEYYLPNMEEISLTPKIHAFITNDAKKNKLEKVELFKDNTVI